MEMLNYLSIWKEFLFIFTMIVKKFISSMEILKIGDNRLDTTTIKFRFFAIKKYNSILQNQYKFDQIKSTMKPM